MTDVDVIYPFRLEAFNATDQTPAKLFPWFVSRLKTDAWYNGSDDREESMRTHQLRRGFSH
jgi:hypothetical protein